MSIQFEVKGTVKTSLDKLKQARAELAALPQDAYKHFVALTPVDTGNARRSTQISGNTITANYAYAERLDKGWSKQAPRGMVKPTEEYLAKRLKQITGK